MTNEEFMHLRKEQTGVRFSMCDEKSVAYTEGHNDRLWNFKQIAKETGQSAKSVLAVYLLKHFHSLMHYIKTDQEAGEGIYRTIDDIQNYLDLLYAMIVEDTWSNPTTTVVRDTTGDY